MNKLINIINLWLLNRVALRECEPEIMNLKPSEESDGISVTEHVLIPPRQTRPLQFEVLTKNPINDVQCIGKLHNNIIKAFALVEESSTIIYSHET